MISASILTDGPRLYKGSQVWPPKEVKSKQLIARAEGVANLPCLVVSLSFHIFHTHEIEIRKISAFYKAIFATSYVDFFSDGK